jgi:hypothetical protein
MAIVGVGIWQGLKELGYISDLIQVRSNVSRPL